MVLFKKKTIMMTCWSAWNAFWS